MAKIKYVFQITSSKVDLNGNTYHAMAVTDTETGARFAGMTDSNGAYPLAAQLGVEYGEFIELSRVLPIRQFNGYVKNLRHCMKNDFVAGLNEAKKEIGAK